MKSLKTYTPFGFYMKLNYLALKLKTDFWQCFIIVNEILRSVYGFIEVKDIFFLLANWMKTFFYLENDGLS